MLLDQTEYSYNPIIKGRGFNPAPVAGKIPYFADSLTNPACIDTKNWEEWWLEQFYYMENGYNTGGMWIPPTMYFFLNFMPIKGLHGTIYPHFIDSQYTLHKLRHEIKQDPSVSGLIIPKARRKSLSIFGNTIAAHGMRFTQDYRMGVAGGLERYVDGFRQKLYMSYNNVPPELKLNYLRRNNNELSNGYEIRNSKGSFDEFVTSLLLFQTLKDKAEKLEGEFFHDVIFEESGQFENSNSAYESIKPALMMGEEVLGTFYIYGTGGNMLKGSKDFKHFWHNYDNYGLVRYFINGARYYYPYYKGAKNEKGEIVEKIPVLNEKYKDLSPEQLLGCEDVVSSEKEIRDERLKRAKNPKKKALTEWNQKFPLTVEEVFTSSGVNNFNSDLLYQQQYNIDSQPAKYTDWILDLVTDENGLIVIPLRATARQAKNTDQDWERISILKHPEPFIRNLDVQGVDGYNEDNSQTSDSMGGIVVVRQYDKYSDPDETYTGHKVVICHYLERPPRKELHWLISLKISVYYNTIKNCMISAESDMVIQYYKENGGKKFLSPRPRAFDAPDTKMIHDYGAKMTTFSKPRMTGLLQSYVEDHIGTCWFFELILNYIAYDYENIGTDWDDVDALGLALMRIVDMKGRIPTNVKEININSDLNLDMEPEENLDDLFIEKSNSGEEKALTTKEEFDL